MCIKKILYIYMKKVKITYISKTNKNQLSYTLKKVIKYYNTINIVHHYTMRFYLYQKIFLKNLKAITIIEH